MEANVLVGLLLFLSSLITSALSAGKYTDYKAQKQWPKTCTTGQSQSPIDIVKDKEEVKSFPPFTFSSSANDELTGTTASNEKQSVHVKDPKFSRITVSGGGLPSEYRLLGLHFHWGRNTQEGSEHLIHGQQFPLEMHAVTFKANFDNIGEALASGETDALAVLGVMFTISEETSPLDPLVAATEAISDPNASESVSWDLSFRDLLPKDVSKFYRYQGSLTTPGCNEQVVWTVFHHALPVPQQLLTHLRQLKSSKGTVTNYNFREPQPLNGRTISASFQQQELQGEDAEPKGSSSWSNTPATLVVTALAFLSTAFLQL